MTATSSAATFNRRSLLLGAGASALSLTGCGTVGQSRVASQPPAQPELLGYADMYAARTDDTFLLPAIPYKQVDKRYLRQIVRDPTGEMAGTVVVDTTNHFLYVVRGGGEAVRYGVGLGREGFAWSGRAVIQWKQHWPRWFPPEEMIARQPELAKYRAVQIPGKNEWEGGMPAGLDNPLGARALYLFQDDKDTLYRLHGSPEWWSIGKSVSSGCVRLINQDVIDLYDRVPDGSPIVVTGGLPVA